MSDYQVYARILRLHHLSNHPSMTVDQNHNMAEIVRKIIMNDRTLVWC